MILLIVQFLFTKNNQTSAIINLYSILQPHFEKFKTQDCLVQRHIPSQFSKEMALQSEVVSDLLQSQLFSMLFI